MEERSDAELLKRSADDPDAFGEFFDRHVEATLAYLHRLTGNVEVALDLTDEVFALALIRRRRYRPRRGPARDWLFAIGAKALAKSYEQHSVERTMRQKLGMAITPASPQAWREVELRLASSASDPPREVARRGRR